ncbi:MAG: hypothetical protein HY402_06550 [Elusimicrobia bacterium]|nr:hypothetical protein [Elusimicrobiota bacterium]
MFPILLSVFLSLWIFPQGAQARSQEPEPSSETEASPQLLRENPEAMLRLERELSHRMVVFAYSLPATPPGERQEGLRVEVEGPHRVSVREERLEVLLQEFGPAVTGCAQEDYLQGRCQVSTLTTVGMSPDGKSLILYINGGHQKKKTEGEAWWKKIQLGVGMGGGSTGGISREGAPQPRKSITFQGSSVELFFSGGVPVLTASEVEDYLKKTYPRPVLFFLGRTAAESDGMENEEERRAIREDKLIPRGVPLDWIYEYWGSPSSVFEVPGGHLCVEWKSPVNIQITAVDYGSGVRFVAGPGCLR